MLSPQTGLRKSYLRIECRNLVQLCLERYRSRPVSSEVGDEFMASLIEPRRKVAPKIRDLLVVKGKPIDHTGFVCDRWNWWPTRLAPSDARVWHHKSCHRQCHQKLSSLDGYHSRSENNPGHDGAKDVSPLVAQVRQVTGLHELGGTGSSRCAAAAAPNPRSSARDAAGDHGVR